MVWDVWKAMYRYVNGESCASSLLQNLQCFLELSVGQTKTLYEPNYDLSQAVT